MRYLIIVLFISSFKIAFSKEISLFSYNTWQLPKILFTAHKPRKRAKAIAIYLQENPLDIIALQEVFTKKAYREISKRLKKSGYYVTLRPRGKFWKGKLINSGLVTYSKYPIISSRFKAFGNCSREDCISRKGALAVLLNMDGKNIYVVNTHLQAGDKYKQVFKRKRQIDELEKFLKSDFFNKRAPVFLVGDINTPMYGPSYEYLMSKLHLVDIKPFGDLEFSYDPKVNKHLKNSNEKRSTFDYVFLYKKSNVISDGTREIIRPVGNYSRFKNIDLSDHFAIKAKFKIKE